MVGEQRVVVGVVQRIGVDHGGGQMRDGVDEPVLGADRDRVGLDHRAVRVDQDRALGPEPAPDAVPCSSLMPPACAKNLIAASRHQPLLRWCKSLAGAGGEHHGPFGKKRL